MSDYEMGIIIIGTVITVTSRTNHMILQKGNYRRKVRNGDCGIMTPQNNLASKVIQIAHKQCNEAKYSLSPCTKWKQRTDVRTILNIKITKWVGVRVRP